MAQLTGVGGEAFHAASKRVVLEAQQAMVAALKAQRYEDALEAAEKVLSVEPGNAMATQFAALIREKIELDDIVSGDEEGEEEGGEGGEEGESSSTEDSESEEEEEEEEGAAVDAAGPEGEDSEEEPVSYPDAIAAATCIAADVGVGSAGDEGGAGEADLQAAAGAGAAEAEGHAAWQLTGTELLLIGKESGESV
eukprot:CAMPEP_0177769356 /NCGR_PEP_ID=MMETSP0491_2-20121128/10270_1 /TAXON_ID=63592 /ORGANISM="Tetraselmis chuii, Strain PLY429" /LENGTH=194 /DNA_ID=CAMNT_0019286343 /DNA_START=308 /DNA_END=891 /DNA_ORIENTATION=+